MEEAKFASIEEEAAYYEKNRLRIEMKLKRIEEMIEEQVKKNHEDKAKYGTVMAKLKTSRKPDNKDCAPTLQSSEDGLDKTDVNK